MADPKAQPLPPQGDALEDGDAEAAPKAAAKRRFRSLATSALLSAKLKAKENTKVGRARVVTTMTNIRVVGTKTERLGFAFMIFLAVSVVIGSVWHTAYKYFHETISSVDFELVPEIRYPIMWACMEWTQVEKLQVQGIHDSDGDANFASRCPPTTDPYCNETASRNIRCVFATNRVKRVSDDSFECMYWRRGTEVTEKLQQWIVQVVPPVLIDGAAVPDNFMCIAANEGGTITDYRERPLFAYLDINVRDPAYVWENEHRGFTWWTRQGERVHLTGYLGVGDNTSFEANTIERHMTPKKTTMGLFNTQNVVDITLDILRNRSADSHDYNIRSSSHTMYHRVGNRDPDHVEQYIERSQIEFKTSTFVVRTVTLRRKYLAELVAELGGIFSFVTILVSGLYVQEGVIYSRIPGRKAGRQTIAESNPLLAAAPSPAPAKASGWWPLLGGSAPASEPVYGDISRTKSGTLKAPPVIQDTNVASHVTPVWVWRWCGEQARFQKARDFALEELPEYEARLQAEVELASRTLTEGDAEEGKSDEKSGKTNNSVPDTWK